MTSQSRNVCCDVSCCALSGHHGCWVLCHLVTVETAAARAAGVWWVREGTCVFLRPPLRALLLHVHKRTPGATCAHYLLTVTTDTVGLGSGVFLKATTPETACSLSS